jgi:hypothetical protein
MIKPKIKKPTTSTRPLIVNGYFNLSRVQYYALLGIITEVISDREKEKKEKLLKDPKAKPKPEKLDDPSIAQEIYNRIGKLYPDSNFNVVILNLLGGEYQFYSSKENVSYLSVGSGKRIFMIFKYKD